jgi:t-SNARE complex subunit (syntaxin)
MQNPELGPQNLESLNASLKNLDNVDAAIRRAEQAGIDVAEQKTQARDARAKIIRIKGTYFPGQ